MIYFGVENNIEPEVGKKYVFLHNGMLHIGECVPCNTGYKWAMKDLNNGKTYYPYCAEVLDIEQPLMSAGWKREDRMFDTRRLD